MIYSLTTQVSDTEYSESPDLLTLSLQQRFCAICLLCFSSLGLLPTTKNASLDRVHLTNEAIKKSLKEWVCTLPQRVLSLADAREPDGHHG